MDSVLTHPTYNQIHNACHEFINVQARRFLLDSNDIIVGLTRGGLIPAAILSHTMNIPMVPVSYSSKTGKGDNKNHRNELPELPASRILLVDDICDSGTTLHQVFYHYEARGYEVHTVALYYKELEDGPIVPDIYWQKIPEDAPWIIFPWEVDHLHA